MSATSNRFLSALALFSAFLLLTSCSSGPSAPEPNTPAFYWQAAKESYATGDYQKTLQHLDDILTSDNEFVARALPWTLVLTSGMSSGYADAADSYAQGSRANKTDPVPFKRMVNQYRDASAKYALQFGDHFRKVADLKGDTISMQFPAPRGSGAVDSLFTKVSAGTNLTAAETDYALQRALERGIMSTASRAAGVPDDTAKLQDLLKTGTGTVPKATFLAAMAQELYNRSELYSSDNLDEPDKREVMLQMAQKTLKDIPETPDSKRLGIVIDTAIKKLHK